MKHTLILALLCCLCTPLLQAQGRAKFPSKKAYHEHVRENSAVTHGTLSHYGGIYGALSGTDYLLSKRTNVPPKTLSSTIITRTKRSPFIQVTRNLKAWHLHQKLRMRDQAILREKLEKQAIARAKELLPPLRTAQAFTVENLQHIIPIRNQQPRPEIPFVAEPMDIAFRGLALSADGDALRNILVNGLRIQDVGEENNTLRLAYASPFGYSAMRHIIENPVINVTYGPHSAVRWGARRLGPDLPILTVVKIRGKFEGDSMETVVENIPTSDIEEVIVRVNLQGNLTWCKVILNTDNTLTLTPYERTAKQTAAE